MEMLEGQGYGFSEAGSALNMEGSVLRYAAAYVTVSRERLYSLTGSKV